MTSFVVVGNGKSAADCINIIENSRLSCELALALVDTTNETMGAGLEKKLAARGLPFLASTHINSPEVLAQLASLAPDYILSVNNFQIIRQPFLDLPKKGVLNFHNSPLPLYAGLNACTWALADGRSEHGVTWHYMDQGVDSGDIIAQRSFPIGESDTAISCIMKSIQEGMALFSDILPQLIAGNVQRVPQDLSRRIFHRKSEIPNGGWLDFSWPLERFSRFVRALNFDPLPNLLARPLAQHAGRSFHVDRVAPAKYHPAGYEPGTVLQADTDLVVALSDAAIRITHVRDEAMRPLSPEQFSTEYALRPGSRLQGAPA